jgi:hypothetical protein
MSGNSDKPKRRRRSAKPRLVALFLLGSDGELYASAPAHALPKGVLEHPDTICAIRLSQVERGIVFETLQTGVQEAARTLSGILKPDA